MSQKPQHYRSKGLRLDDLPQHRRTRSAVPGGYVYAVEFSTGIIKVGRTNRPRVRVADHLRDAQKFGGSIEQLWLSVEHVNYIDNERSLIQNLGRAHSGYEYYSGLDFNAVVEQAEALSFGVLNDEGRARYLADEERAAQEAGERWARIFKRREGYAVSMENETAAAIFQMLFGIDRKLPVRSDAEPLPASAELAAKLGHYTAVTGVDLEEIAAWSHVDMLRHLAIQHVNAAAMMMLAQAHEQGRDDLTRPNFFGLERTGVSLYAEPDVVETGKGSMVVGVGDSPSGEYAIVGIERASGSAQLELTLAEVDELVESLRSVRETMTLDVDGGAL